jgi:diacylglycerol kinase (ATP)
MQWVRPFRALLPFDRHLNYAIIVKDQTRIIINPTAGAGSTARLWPQIQTHLERAGLSFEFRFTERTGHATELAKEAAESGFGCVVAVGGDGTIQEVANGLLQAPNPKNIVLGIICTGTGSDLSRSVGISRKIEESCLSLTQRRVRTIDMGLVSYYGDGKKQQRYFINSAGIGFDAAVVAATEKLPKYIGGTIPYVIGLVRSFLFYRNKCVTLTVNGESPRPLQALSVVVANGQYFGGGMRVAPEAVMDDGLFDIVIMGDFGKIELLREFPKVYKGNHLTLPKIHLTRGTLVTIESSDQFLLQADGEVLGTGPVSFELIPQALNLIV